MNEGWKKTAWFEDPFGCPYSRELDNLATNETTYAISRRLDLCFNNLAYFPEYLLLNRIDGYNRTMYTNKVERFSSEDDVSKLKSTIK